MKPSTWIIGASSLLLVAAAVVLLVAGWRGEASSNADVAPAPHHPARSPLDPGLDDPGSVPGTLAADEDTTRRRAAGSELPAVLSGVVRLPDGEPVPDGSRVLWARRIPAPLDRGWEGWTRATFPDLETTVDGGRFTFSVSPPGERRDTLVVALGAMFTPGAVSVGEETSLPPITVASHAPLLVEVVDDERPVDEVLVEYVGAVLLDGRSYLVRGRTKGGHVPLLAGTFRLRARAGGQCSPPWWGTLEEAGGRVTLRLEKALQVSATVHGGEREGLELAVRGPGAEWNETVEVLSVPREGRLRPRPVPWLGLGEYHFRLQGPGIVPQHVSRELENTLDPVRLEFELREGLRVGFLLQDQEEQPLAGVRVHLIWSTEAGWVRDVRTSDSDGRAVFDACPPARHWVRAYADGYVNELHGSFDIFEELGDDVVLTLRRAATLQGRVTRQGEPVERFTLVHWPKATDQRARQPFSGQEDGRFELATLPPGEVQLFAVEPDGACSSVADLVLREGEAEEVELTIEEPARCSGTVLDSGTGLPLAGATIQPWAAWKGAPLESAGTSATTGQAGRFQDLTVPNAEAVLHVQAEGYGDRWISMDGESDLGSIGLTRVRDLQVQLVAPAGTDFGDYKVGSSKAVSTQAVPVDGRGRATLRMRSGGHCGVHVYVPGSSRIDAYLELVPDEPWEVRVPVETGVQVRTRLRWQGSREERPETLWMFAYFTAEDGTPYTQVHRIADDDTSTFACAAGTRALFSVTDDDGRRYGSRSAELDTGTEWIEVDASPDWTSRLAITGGDGDPLSFAVVVLRPAGGTPHQALTEIADERGEVPVGHFGGKDFEVAVGDAQGWLAPWQTVPWEDEELLHLNLEGDAAVTVRLNGADGPVGGVPVRLRVPGRSQLNTLVSSDAEGLARFGFLEASSYQLAVQGDGWWPVRQTVTASLNPSVLEVPMRRRGGLVFRVRRDGLPVQGVQLELKSLEEGDDLSVWITSGEVQLGDTGLTTDVKGEVRLLGAPEGSYRWSLPEAGDSAWGTVELVGGEVGEVEVVHP